MFDLASIRNASFTLTPTGYNPEEVDQFLADLADHLAAEISAMPAVPPVPDHAVAEQPAEPAPLQPPALADLSDPSPRSEADLDGLAVCVERTIASLDSFVHNELVAVKTASELEIEEIHRERERLLEEAADAARAHLDDARVRAERIVVEARGDGDALRQRFEQELAGERERFERALLERDAEAEARIAEVLARAEERRRDADEMVSQAARVQTQVLQSLEQARASLGPIEATASPEPQAAQVEPLREDDQVELVQDAGPVEPAWQQPGDDAPAWPPRRAEWAERALQGSAEANDAEDQVAGDDPDSSDRPADAADAAA